MHKFIAQNKVHFEVALMKAFSFEITQASLTQIYSRSTKLLEVQAPRTNKQSRTHISPTRQLTCDCMLLFVSSVRTS